MLDRILTGWNVQRIFYLIAGGGMIAVSLFDHQWFGAAIGLYFASMGLFAFGCASGNCLGGSCDADQKSGYKTDVANELTNTKPN